MEAAAITVCMFHIYTTILLSIAIEPQREVGGLEVVSLFYLPILCVCVRHFGVEVPVYRHTRSPLLRALGETERQVLFLPLSPSLILPPPPSVCVCVSERERECVCVARRRISAEAVEYVHEAVCLCAWVGWL